MVREVRGIVLATALVLLNLLAASSGAQSSSDRDDMSSSLSESAVRCPEHACQEGAVYASSHTDGQILCYCDNQCAFYQDCCYNAPDARPKDYSVTSCVELNLTVDALRKKAILGLVPLVSGYRLITKCPLSWSDELSRSGCETPDKSDAISITPVTGGNNVTYNNVYCAICNQESIADVLFWSFDPTTCLFDEMFDGFVENRQWFAALNSAIYECDGIQYTPPRSVDINTLRHCVPNEVSECPPDYNDASVVKACKSHIAVVSHQRELYRNSFCAECNGLQIDPGQPCEFAIDPSRIQIPPLSVLFGFQPQETQISSQNHQAHGSGELCRQNEMYDPFADKCRSLFCKHGFILKHGRCVPHLKSQTNCTSNQGIITATIRVPEKPDTGQCKKSVQEQCPPLHELFKQHDLTLVVCSSTETNPEVYIQVEFTAENISLKAIENKLILKLNAEGSQCELQDLRVVTKCYGNWSARGSCRNASHRVNDITIQHGLATVSNLSIAYNLNETPFEMTYTFNDANQSVDQIYTFYLCNEQCPEISLEPGTFVVNGSSVILIKRGIVLSESEFRWQDGRVFVCVDLIDFQNTIFQFDSVQVILTLIGTILSMIALLLCLVTYVVFPTLRNLPGKSVMSLIAALFTGQLLLLFVGNATENQTFCTVVAVILHYIWLASFSWTSAIAFYLSRTLGTQARPRATEHRDCDKKFLQFSLHGWGTPLVIIITCVGIEFCSHIPIVYGTEKVCWIGNNLALISAFFLPIAVTLLVNAFLYARILIFFTFRGIASNGESMDKLRKKRLKRDAMVSLKVAFLMGFTWVFAFIAYYTNLDLLWYVFIIFNSSQGLYIFLAFTCTPHVITLWKTKLDIGAKPETTSPGEKHRMVTRTSSPNGNGRLDVTTYTQGSPLAPRAAAGAALSTV